MGFVRWASLLLCDIEMEESIKTGSMKSVKGKIEPVLREEILIN